MKKYKHMTGILISVLLIISMSFSSAAAGNLQTEISVGITKISYSCDSNSSITVNGTSCRNTGTLTFVSGSDIELATVFSRGYRADTVTITGTTYTQDGNTYILDNTMPCAINVTVVSKQGGQVINVTDPDDNYMRADIAPEQNLKDIVLTEEQKAKTEDGKDCAVWLELKEQAPTEGPKEALDKLAKEKSAQNVSYFEASIYSQMEDEAPVRVTSTNGMLLVEMDFDEELQRQASGKKIYVLRYHGGKAEAVDCTYDSSVGKLRFESDRFSPYSIAAAEESHRTGTWGTETKLYRYAEPTGKLASVSKGRWELLDAEKRIWIFTYGSQRANGGWYYINNPYGDNRSSCDWFYFNSEGIMQYGWICSSKGNWYYTREISDGNLGRLEYGWHKDRQDKKWYFLDRETGRMAVGWRLIDGKEYYFAKREDTFMSGWFYQLIDGTAFGKWITNITGTKAYGSMFENETTPDGAFVGPDGAKAKDPVMR